MMSSKKMPKILFTLDTLALGGAELRVLELVKNINDFEVHIAIIYKANHSLKRNFEDNGIKLYFLEIKERFGFWKAAYLLRKIIYQIKPDIVHSTHFRTEIISRLALILSNVPLIGTLNSDTYSQERYALVSQREKVKLNLYKWLNRLTAFRPNLYISVSESIVKPNKKYLWIRDSKIVVIPNGRNVYSFVEAMSYKKQDFFPQIKKNDKIIVSNSRVIKSKGFDEIFKAFQFLINNKKNLYLMIIGEGRDLEKYKLFCLNHGLSDRVLFLGKRLDIARLLKTSDIFWFASHYEGSPGVVIEGMLSQLPIIASNISPVIENLTHNKNALLFEKGQWIDLANKTNFLLENWGLKDQFVKNSFELARNKFDIKLIAEKYEEVYKRFLKSK